MYTEKELQAVSQMKKKRWWIALIPMVAALAAAIVLLGIISVFDLPIEQYPDITPPVVEVSATYPGADAETVNNAVATPVSQSIMGVSDMLYMQATSANDGSMNLQVTFDIGSDPNMDAIFTQNNVSTALSQLPASVTQQGVTTRKTMTGFLIVYSLTSDGRYTGDFLSNYAYINIQNELLKIDGVGKVDIMGAGEYAMRIWLKPDLLDYYKISLDEVFAAVEAQGGIFPAGKFGGEPAAGDVAYTYTVTMPPQITTAEQFGDIVVVTTSEGEQIRLRDVADASCMPRIAARVGQEMDVLVEGREEDGQLFGRAMCQAPEVDGVVYLDAGEVGQVVRVRIVDTLLYEMEGELA